MIDPKDSGSLRGQLSVFQLVELVQAIGMGNTSGALHLHHAAGRRGIIYFDNGALIWSREYHPDALTLGSVLQQLGFAAAQTIEDFYDRQVKEPLGEMLGQRLVAANVLKPEQLEEALRTQTLWTVREIALWKDGDYHFMVGEKPPPRTATFPIDSSRVGLEIIRYQYEWNNLQSWLPDGMHTRLQMALEPPAEHPLIFPTPVWRAITRVNAFQTPRRIATALYQPELEVARILAPLVSEALIYAKMGEHSVELPAVARTITAQHVDLFTLFSRMEQDWRKRKSPVEQVIALATYINWTMDALDDAWRQNGLVLPADSLATLLQREGCTSVLGHPLRIVGNQVIADDLAAFLRQLANHPMRELHEAYAILSQALRAVFIAINQRVDSLQDRNYYELAWTELFSEFRESLK